MAQLVIPTTTSATDITVPTPVFIPSLNTGTV